MEAWTCTAVRLVCLSTGVRGEVEFKGTEAGSYLETVGKPCFPLLMASVLLVYWENHQLDG